MFAPTRTAADAAAAAPDESRRGLIALLETMDACARRRGARPSQILAAATLPKGLPHTPACVSHSSTNATNKSHRREVQSFDSRRHHSPLTTDEPRE